MRALGQSSKLAGGKSGECALVPSLPASNSSSFVGNKSALAQVNREGRTVARESRASPSLVVRATATSPDRKQSYACPRYDIPHIMYENANLDASSIR